MKKVLIKNENEKVVPYTKYEIANFNNGKVQVVNNETEIVKFAKNAKIETNNKKIYFGKISAFVANKINKILGINLEGYNISLSNNGIRHTYNNHGSDAEYLRGNYLLVNMTLNIFLK